MYYTIWWDDFDHAYLDFGWSAYDAAGYADDMLDADFYGYGWY